MLFSVRGRANASPPGVRTKYVESASLGRDVEMTDEIKDAEMILTAFRTLILAVVFAAPRILDIPISYNRGEIVLGALAGLYNIGMGVACLFPGRYGVRRPFVLAMDTMLITVWLHYSGSWEIISFYYIVVVAAAMWYRVAGGVMAAAVCDFLVLFLWGRVASDSAIFSPPPFTASMAINASLLFMVGGLAGYMSEAQERERESRIEHELLIANYEKEIDVAAQLQPLLIGRLVQGEHHLELGSAFQTARVMAGGDYLDALRLPGGQTLVCIADVAGKSVRAQARVPLLKYSLRALAPIHPHAAELIERIQESLAEELQPELYIALCLIVLDGPSQTLTWCNAGHIAPLLVRPGGEPGSHSELIPLETTTPAMGLFPELKPAGRSEQWLPGDALLLFTDGLADALSFGGSEDGEEQVRKLARRISPSDPRSAQEWAKNIVNIAQSALNATGVPSGGRRGREPQGGMRVHRDDLAVLVARFLPGEDLEDLEPGPGNGTDAASRSTAVKSPSVNGTRSRDAAKKDAADV